MKVIAKLIAVVALIALWGNANAITNEESFCNLSASRIASSTQAKSKGIPIETIAEDVMHDLGYTQNNSDSPTNTATSMWLSLLRKIYNGHATYPEINGPLLEICASGTPNFRDDLYRTTMHLANQYAGPRVPTQKEIQAEEKQRETNVEVNRCIAIAHVVIQAVAIRDAQGSPQQALDEPLTSRMDGISTKEKKNLINAVFFDPSFAYMNTENVSYIMDQETGSCIRSINAPKYQPLK